MALGAMNPFGGLASEQTRPSGRLSGIRLRALAVAGALGLGGAIGLAAALAPAAAARQSVAVQGDSMAVAARPYLLARLRPDDVISYRAHAGRPAAAAAALLAHQRLGEVVVFAVGTDRYQSPASYRASLGRAVRTAGAGRCLVIPTLYDRRHGRSMLNRVIERFAAARRQSVKIADWSRSALSRHVRLRDGGYPADRSGWRLYAASLATATRACERATGVAFEAAAGMPWPGNAGRVELPRTVRPAPVPSAAAHDWWTVDGGSRLYTIGWRNGQCTELAWARRPDIVAQVAEDWYDQSAAGQAPAPVRWDATFWDANAAAAGFQVGLSPRANAIMVYHSHDYPAWPGHLAWVQTVNPDGSFVVQEEDVLSAGHVTTRTIEPRDLLGSDIDFIY